MSDTLFVLAIIAAVASFLILLGSFGSLQAGAREERGDSSWGLIDIARATVRSPNNRRSGGFGLWLGVGSAGLALRFLYLSLLST